MNDGETKKNYRIASLGPIGPGLYGAECVGCVQGDPLAVDPPSYSYSSKCPEGAFCEIHIM